MRNSLLLQDGEYLSTSALAERIGLTPNWLRELAVRDTIPSIKIGRKRWFKLSAVLAILGNKTYVRKEGTDNAKDILAGL